MVKPKVVATTALVSASLMLGACSVEPSFVLDYLARICTSTTTADSPEAAFYDENTAAMTRMMVDMNVRPSGDVDAAFANMMAAHHRGAISMAVTELRYGHNERLKRIAQEIIITQQQEIIAMQATLRSSKQSQVSNDQALAD